MRLPEFLETVPPNVKREIEKLYVKGEGSFASYEIADQTATFHCDSGSCKGPRIFRAIGFEYFKESAAWSDQTVIYKCQNCGNDYKYISIRLQVLNWHNIEKGTPSLDGTAFKFGQIPQFRIPRVPTKLLELVGPDQELFEKGRKCELEGLGVGAFAYYRQIVERQKDRILEAAIKVAKRAGSDAEAIESLEEAKREYQFTKGVNSVNVIFPPTLLIKGENPLTLLHAALSGGLHSGNDEECLDRAHSIRLILVEYCNRVAEVLKDDSELTNAVNKLKSVIPKKSLPPPGGSS